MDGLGLKFAKSPLEGNFIFDQYGALIPNRDNLRMEQVANRLSRQLRSKTGLYTRMTDLYYRTDVEFTDNPLGNTPTMGWGYKRYGSRPMNMSHRDRVGNLKSVSPDLRRRLHARERKIENDQREYMHLYETLDPHEQGTSKEVSYLVEGSQVMTGGGFDANHVGDVNKSALLFVTKGSKHVEFGDNQFSQFVVEGALKLQAELEKAGLRKGSLEPVGASSVRVDQENDGLIGFPVYDHGWKEFSQDVATRLLIETGVDARKLVGQRAIDPRTGEQTTTRVIQGIAYVLDNLIIQDPAELPSLVTLLARIQAHGWKEEEGSLVPKKPKTRSVYPEGALPGIQGAMVWTPLIKAIQELKVPFMPSVQDKPTRVKMIKLLYQAGRKLGYEWLSLDEDQYDATIIGGAFATVMYYAFRPFFNAKWYDWVDMAIYSLIYKYIICDTALCRINPGEFSEAKANAPVVEVKPFTVFGMTDGLVSGAKLTHVGGSYYGGAVIHYAMPKMMGFEPFIGVQAGDDCLWAYPRDRVFLDSQEKTYKPVEDAAASVGISINTSKQIWYVVNEELVNIFLQDIYHESTDTWGVGSIFRPLSKVFFAERDKGLSIAEQFMAEIARMEVGSDSPFAPEVVQHWLSKEEFIGLLFKEYGVSAFDKIVDSVGDDIEEIAKRIEVGSFSFGISRDDLKEHTLAILPIIADVASRLEYKTTLAEALKSLGDEDTNVEASIGYTESLTDEENPDLGDSEDILAD